MVSDYDITEGQWLEGNYPEAQQDDELVSDSKIRGRVIRYWTLEGELLWEGPPENDPMLDLLVVDEWTCPDCVLTGEEE